jgi:protein required for attachment to host cells
MQSNWILIASRAGARILEKLDGKFLLVEEIPHDEGRLRDRDVDTDRPGRSFDRAAAGRHALNSSEAPHDHLASGFARELAKRLATARATNQFDQLTVAAEPRFLGMLKGALDDVTARRVQRYVAKDLHHIPPREIGEYLEEPS